MHACMKYSNMQKLLSMQLYNYNKQYNRKEHCSDRFIQYTSARPSCVSTEHSKYMAYYRLLHVCISRAAWPLIFFSVSCFDNSLLNSLCLPLIKRGCTYIDSKSVELLVTAFDWMRVITDTCTSATWHIIIAGLSSAVCPLSQ